MDDGVPKLWAILLLAAVVVCLPFRAVQAEELDTQLNERVLMLPGSPERAVALQVTVFSPPGAGPFPLAVINHGKNRGEPRDEPRWRAPYVARYFLSRGYAVAIPMARGFAGSGGVFDGMGCDAENDGLAKAQDVRGVILALQRESFVDPSRVVVMGQSYGGWTTLALGALEVPGVKALANFAGGRRTQRCPDYKSDLSIAAGHYAQHTKAPSIWFYGDNDQTFAADVWHAMFDAYQAHGGRGELVAYGNFVHDAHYFLALPEGASIWGPRMDAFLAAQGLPTKLIQPEIQTAQYPPPSGFAKVEDIDAVPFLKEAGREGYRQFLKEDIPRVFVIARGGFAVNTFGGFDPLARAMARCAELRKTCRAYAVDNDVVWVKPMVSPPATNFAAIPGGHPNSPTCGHLKFLHPERGVTTS
jgi:dienelactone hydrolase